MNDGKSLSNIRIVLDPQGGLYYAEQLDEWRFQKGRISGTHADLFTAEISSTVFDLLRTVGADVLSTRCERHSFKERGDSAEPLFHEGAGQYLKNRRIRDDLHEVPGRSQLPEAVWNVGATNLERDRNARAHFVRYVRADLHIALEITRDDEFPGPHITHNGRGDTDTLGSSIAREIGKRIRRGPLGLHALVLATHEVPSLTVVCGSTLDLDSQRRLSRAQYRQSIALGIFAGIWKHLAADEPLSAFRSCPTNTPGPQ